MPEIEAMDEYISLRRASELSGVGPGTLRNQALAGKLHTVKLAGNHVTTRRWLHAYLKAADAQKRGRRKPLPPNYVAPE